MTIRDQCERPIGHPDALAILRRASGVYDLEFEDAAGLNAAFCHIVASGNHPDLVGIARRVLSEELLSVSWNPLEGLHLIRTILSAVPVGSEILLISLNIVELYYHEADDFVRWAREAPADSQEEVSARFIGEIDRLISLG